MFIDKAKKRIIANIDTKYGYFLYQVLDTGIHSWIYFEATAKKFHILRKPELDNIFYVSTSKTGSEWVKRVLSDPLITRRSRMNMYRGRWVKQNPERKIPPYTFTSSLGITWETYLKIPKPQNYKTLYIQRDPRDILISWYYSTLYSHSKTELIMQYREKLQKMTKAEGLVYTLDILNRTAYEQMRSWIHCTDQNVMFLSYEDLVSDSVQSYKRIFEHFKWDVPARETEAVVDKYSFKKQSGGRNFGEEDIKSHQRKGIPGDWKNHFDESLISRFNSMYKDLLMHYGYEQE